VGVVLSEGYARRPVRPLPMVEVDGWRLKVHGIAYRGEVPRPELVDAARRVAGETLPRPAVGEGRYGVGFLGVHDGRDAGFVFVDWWAQENELHHHAFVSPLDRPADLVAVQPGMLTACAWDLAVIAHERDAWVETVLANPAGPDVEAYLARELRADV
jgi:hypothetical protein